MLRRHVLAAVVLLVGTTAGPALGCSTDAECVDATVCNGHERCVDGTCRPGLPLACDDTNPCTIDSCDAVAGCRHDPLTNGLSCGDGNLCNGGELCQNGVCAAGAPPPDGTSCSDGEVCNGREECHAGVCARGTPLADDSACGDTNPCNGAETCQRGACVGGVPLADGTACGGADPCGGGGVCQGKLCVASAALPDGTSCSDGNVCNGAEFCTGHVCVAGAPPANGTSCSDGEACNGIERCRDGACTPGTPLPEGNGCSDGNPCNGRETCQGGACTPGVAPADGQPCGDTDPCNGVEACQGGVCVTSAPLPDGASCADNTVCNGDEKCANQLCSPGPRLRCEDNNPCTADSCNPVTGCRHLPVSDGTRCGDANPCNGMELCEAGVCLSGLPLPDGWSCADSNPCNGEETCRDAACVPGTRLADGASCSDGNTCNGEESCRSGTCLAGVALDCNDFTPCTDDWCDRAVGCRHAPLGEGAFCKDGDACNGDERCHQGACIAGPPPVCTDANPATTDFCDPARGCQHTNDRATRGTRLVLRAKGTLRLDVRDAALDATLVEGEDGDPTEHGGSLRIQTTAGGGFDRTFPLAADGWRNTGKPDGARGYRYQDTYGVDGPVRLAIIKRGRIRVIARGLGLVPDLGVDPDPVRVSVILGSDRYCMSFGGITRFVAGAGFRASAAPPGACPR